MNVQYSCLRQVLLLVIGFHACCRGFDGRLSLSHYRGHHRTHSMTPRPMMVVPSNHGNNVNDENSAIGTTITVSYEGQSCNIQVLPNESILSALERQAKYVQSQLTTLPDMPSDCRRGNCMTCAAQIRNHHRNHNNQDVIIRRHDNGLSPIISNLIADQGYLLTCSSFVAPPRQHDATTTTSDTSNMIQLELGVHHEIWQEVYDRRFTTPETQYVAQAAMARVLRQSAERNPEEWRQSTERLLRRPTETTESDAAIQ